MYKPSRYAVKGDPLGNPLGGDLRRARIFRADDPIAAVIGGATSLLGGMMSSDAASSAADTQADAANKAAQMQKDEFDQVRSDLEPYRNLGTAAINPLLQAMGYNVNTPSTPQLTYDQIYQQLLPQYTSNSSTPVSMSQIPSQISQLISRDPNATYTMNPATGQYGWRYTRSTGGDADMSYTDWYYPQGSSSQSGTSVDTAGLDAAVQAQLQQQQNSSYSDILSNLTKDPNNILNQTFSFNPGDLTKTPGYEWNYAQGMRAVNNSAASRGLGLSGAQLKGAETFASGLADNTYQNQYNNALTQYQTNYNAAANNVNRLLSLLGIGQSSATQTGAYGMQSAANQGNYLTSGANAQASGTVGSANALTGALNGIGNNALLYSMLGNNSNSGSGNGVTLYGIKQ